MAELARGGHTGDRGAEARRRWQWWSYVYLASEVVIGLVGFAAGLWLLLRGDAFAIVIGVGTLAFTAAVSAVSIWARSLSVVRHDDPVMQTVSAAIRRARSACAWPRLSLVDLCCAGLLGGFVWLFLFTARLSIRSMAI